MKYLLAAFVSLGLFLFGCVSVEVEKTAETGETALLQEKKAEEREKSEDSLEGEEQRKIIDAIEYALSLEAYIWDRREQINERQDVFNILRKGFCRIKAEEITDYIWIEAVDRSGNKFYMLNPGEPLFSPPGSIEIVFVDRKNARALLRYDENLQGPVTWAGHTVVAALQQEEGVWKICETRVEEQVK
jgi:hypothetical protein